MKNVNKIFGLLFLLAGFSLEGIKESIELGDGKRLEREIEGDWVTYILYEKPTEIFVRGLAIMSNGLWVHQYNSTFNGQFMEYNDIPEERWTTPDLRSIDNPELKFHELARLFTSWRGWHSQPDKPDKCPQL